MGSRNNTNVPDFMLMGLTDSEDIRQVLFMLFILVYLVTVLRNAGMILVTRLDLQLHTPMYFFPVTCHSLTLVTQKSSRQNLREVTDFKQVYFIHRLFYTVACFVSFCVPEYFLLSSMAYSCYVAICRPLHYQVVMATRLCCILKTSSYMIDCTESLVFVFYMNNLLFCSSNVIYHFLCDITPILALSCADTCDTEILIFILSSLNVMVSLTIIFATYVFILPTILKINFPHGKCKAFSTCASQLLGFTYYCTTIFMYLRPRKSYFLGKDQVASVFYIMVIPMLNPLIYSLRNKEVNNAIIRAMQRRESSSQLK